MLFIASFFCEGKYNSGNGVKSQDEFTPSLREFKFVFIEGECSFFVICVEFVLFEL